MDLKVGRILISWLFFVYDCLLLLAWADFWSSVFQLLQDNWHLLLPLASPPLKSSIAIIAFPDEVTSTMFRQLNNVSFRRSIGNFTFWVNNFLSDLSYSCSIGLQFCLLKVHIFWEGHKIFRNLHRRFDRYYMLKTYLRW